MERWPFALARIGALTLGVLVGCGGSGTVDLDLVHAPFDDPYRGLDRLHAKVLDSQGTVIVERDLDPFAPTLAIDGLSPGSGRVVRLLGYAGTTLISRGQSAPLVFSADGSYHAPIGFSTLPVAVALPVAVVAPGGTINLDGALDDWAGAPVVAELHPANAAVGMPKDDADLSAKIYLAWDANALYVAVHVLDDCVVCDDTVPDKVIVSWDGRADRESASYGPDDGNATIGPTVTDAGTGVRAASSKATGNNVSEYIVEVRISNDAMGGALTAGGRVGFEVELFDGSGGDYKVEAWVPSPDALNRRPYPAEMGTIGIVQYP
jgi:cellulose/xylan binding protein with CBM9 domain